MLQNGADVNAAGENGQTPLHMATRKYEQEILDILLEQPGLNLDPVGSEGWTPLTGALAFQNYEAAEKLLEAGADMMAETQMGYPAYCYIERLKDAEADGKIFK